MSPKFFTARISFYFRRIRAIGRDRREGFLSSRRIGMRYAIAVLLICSLICPTFAQDPGWPREKSNADGSIVYYQPQLDEWRDFKQLEARMAVSIRPKGGQPTVGVI